MDNPFSLKGQTALITGGGTGIGYGVAECFVAAGARVVLVGRRADVLKDAVTKLGNQAAYEVCDITQLEQLPAVYERIHQKIGRVSILVNNAGNHVKKPPSDTTTSDFESILRLHVMSAFEITKIFVKDMTEGGGSIVFMASMASFLAIPLVSAYSTAKAGLVGLTRSLAADYSPCGIRVNAIAPGWIETPLLHEALDNDPERMQKIITRTPLGSLGTIRDIGWAAVYLCSPAARFITGTVLPVDGGASVGF